VVVVVVAVATYYRPHPYAHILTRQAAFCVWVALCTCTYTPWPIPRLRNPIICLHHSQFHKSVPNWMCFVWANFIGWGTATCILTLNTASCQYNCKWYLSLIFPHQNPECASSLPQTCHMPSLSHFSITSPKYKQYLVLSIHHKPLIMQCPLVPCYLTPLVSQYLPQALFIPRSSLKKPDEVWHWRKPTGRPEVVCVLIFMSSDSLFFCPK
jgi:hypothetical protein